MKFDSMGRPIRLASQGGCNPLPDADNAIKAGDFEYDCPYETGTSAELWWKWAIPALRSMGILDKADVMLLELTADCYQVYCDAAEALKQHGHLLLCHTNAGAESMKRNPALQTLESARKDLQKFYSHLGLTPSARAKLGGQGEEDDPMKDIEKKQANAFKTVHS